MKNSEPANENRGYGTRPLMDVEEAAHMLCVSVRFIRILLTRGDLPVVRLGRRTLVRRADVDALVERGGVEKTA